MPFFLESCRRNADIDWLLFSDCGTPPDLPPNVTVEAMTFGDYCELVSKRLGIEFAPGRPTSYATSSLLWVTSMLIDCTATTSGHSAILTLCTVTCEVTSPRIDWPVMTCSRLMNVGWPGICV